MISGNLSIKYGLKGPNLAIVTACTTGLHCIGQAARMIEYGDADAMIAGGAESTISPLGLGGFASACASSRNDDPATALVRGTKTVMALYLAKVLVS
jgi:3-oxoacyl-[acyl-carrier-protein] synthase II